MKRLAAAVLFACAASAAAAEPGKVAVPADVPPALQPWAPWVLRGHEAEACPFLAAGGERACVWPGTLELSLDDKGGRFALRASVWVESLVPLAGDEKHWPQGVTVDGERAALVARDGRPSVQLSPGEHAIAGTLVWDALPEALPVPPQIGLLSLTVRGQKLAYPTRDEGGVVWLQKKAGEGDKESALEVVVHRKVADEVPLVLTTRVSLRIAGKNREELLGRALPEQFVPMALSSPLPARLDPDGRLRVQARPGSFTLEITARHEGPVEALALGAAGGPWAEEEVWVFDARPYLRQVVVEGVPGLDPQQTTLSDDWKRLPGYRLRPGVTMALKEKQRGDAEPSPDQLSLLRTLWLDADGGGFGFLDQVGGRLSRSWRLSMAPPAELGRVAVSGQDVLITRLAAQDPPGVEVRQGALQLVAEGRIEGTRAAIPAVGWTSDFQSAGAVLNLPPGWRLFAAFGADDVPGTWVRTWNLLDLFLMLICALATARLFGWRAGLLCLFALALVIPEDGAPPWALLAVLCCEVLGRVLPDIWLRKVVRVARVLALGVLALILLVFSIGQIRTGLHPVLEHPGVSMGESTGAAPGYLSATTVSLPVAAEPAEVQDQKERPADELGAAMKPEDRPASKLSLDGRRKSGGDQWAQTQAQRQFKYEYDTSTTVQTGKGLPRWAWNQISIRWSGPVDHGQMLTLVLSPPWLNGVLAFLRVLLSALLLVVVASMPGRFWPEGMRRALSPPVKGAAAVAAAIACLLAGGSARAQSPVPDSATLDQLRERLLTPPRCFPHCASLARMSLEASQGRLKARIEAHAVAQSGVPLPGSAQGFVPEQVLVDGRSATLRRGDDGSLWILLPAGSHEILLDGPLPPREVIPLPLPLRPHRVEARAEGYTVEGIHEDGLPDENLLLTRVRGQGEAASAALAPGQLPAFVRVERTLSLGLTWQASTRVVRLTPPGAAVVLEVPLLPGEQVTTADVRVAGGKALVSMAPQATEVEWRSALEIRPGLELKASPAASFIESWRLEASPVWHVDWKGIPAIHPADAADRTPEWRPWPGESLSLSVARPAGVPGQTLTVNSTRLSVKPGVRSTEATLALVLRSSRGGQHAVRLPEGAELQSVSINGQVQPIRQERDQVALPLVPGEQRVELSWRQAQGLSTFFRSPEVDLGLPGVNADLRIELPRERWILFAGGDARARVGPAVLFWSLLIVLLLVAVGLGLSGWSPLRWWSWMLLAAGLTQISVVAAILPPAWLLLLEWRRRTPEAGRWAFNLRQVGLVLLTLVALGVLFVSIHQGLLGLPDMQVEGNGSTESELRWFADRSLAALPRPWVISVPLLAYRGAMLLWALWVAWSLLNWLRWGFGAFVEGGAWQPKPRKQPAGKPVSG